MELDRDKLVFFSNDPIDKIVASGDVTIVNDGNTTASGTGGGSQVAKIVQQSFPHTYGKPGFIRARWSTDNGATWNGIESEKRYTFTITFTDVGVTSSPIPNTDSAITIGANSSVVVVRTANGSHGNVVTNTAAPPTHGYTPQSRTFRVQYWMFERE